MGSWFHLLTLASINNIVRNEKLGYFTVSLKGGLRWNMVMTDAESVKYVKDNEQQNFSPLNQSIPSQRLDTYELFPV